MNDKINEIASKLYTVYCNEVGGVAFNGDILPTWAEFTANPEKAKQVKGWLSVAQYSFDMMNNKLEATQAMDKVNDEMSEKSCSSEKPESESNSEDQGEPEPPQAAA